MVAHAQENTETEKAEDWTPEAQRLVRIWSFFALVTVGIADFGVGLWARRLAEALWAEPKDMHWLYLIGLGAVFVVVNALIAHRGILRGLLVRHYGPRSEDFIVTKPLYERTKASFDFLFLVLIPFIATLLTFTALAN